MYGKFFFISRYSKMVSSLMERYTIEMKLQKSKTKLPKQLKEDPTNVHNSHDILYMDVQEFSTSS